MDTSNIQQIKQRYSIVGNSDGLNRALDIAVQVAPTDLSVLIIGESGVGKEVLPKVIHDNSARKHNKYFAINCGSIPEGTIDSELFGHTKGAFTGAIGEREGYFGAANKGTLFLDEVGELPLATQARLLRVLETGEYLRVGESEVRKTDVRIVAATNVNMQKAIREGRFREDLYYRLNTIPISLPPLRERGRDIEMLFRKFAIDISEKYGRDPIRLTPDAKELIMAYKWPGNIRQLRNLTEQISIISPEREITSEILKQFGVTNDNTEGGLVLTNPNNGSQHSYENERELLFHLLTKIGNEMKDLKDYVRTNIGNVQHRQQENTPARRDDFMDTEAILNDGITFGTNDGIKITTVQQKNANNSQTARQPQFVEAEPDSIIETPLTIKEIEKMKIIEALKRNNSSRKKTANELGLSERTLYRKIKEYGINL
ncbi:MAG: sigma-54 dependent transcriptional regulator [Bacteroidaceae bacterium]|nr:sigma-54 dependent transcriptional regulator [Bacteroidaceae bacterium]